MDKTDVIDPTQGLIIRVPLHSWSPAIVVMMMSLNEGSVKLSYRIGETRLNDDHRLPVASTTASLT